jgi:hypothetical protein
MRSRCSRRCPTIWGRIRQGRERVAEHRIARRTSGTHDARSRRRQFFGASATHAIKGRESPSPTPALKVTGGGRRKLTVLPSILPFQTIIICLPCAPDGGLNLGRARNCTFGGHYPPRFEARQHYGGTAWRQSTRFWACQNQAPSGFRPLGAIYPSVRAG